jgi:hypothetical protein
MLRLQVTFERCLLSMLLSNTAANPGIVAPEFDLVISLAWQGTDANKRYCARCKAKRVQTLLACS